MIKTPVVDYRKLRFRNICSAEYRHLLLLLYWPFYGLLFLFVERFYSVDSYFPMYCPLDDRIPFCEWFLIPYLIWFLYIPGMLIYVGVYDIPAFRKMMYYVMFTYSVAIISYFLFPTCQELRPPEFPRDNLLTRLIAGFYQFDTNTNVCPSVHVIGALAVMETALWTDTIRGKGWKLAIVISAILISISTVFMKQHSILDVLASVIVCTAAHFLFFRKRKEKNYGERICFVQ